MTDTEQPDLATVPVPADLVAALEAADLDWRYRTGDPEAEPDYLRHLAAAVALYAPETNREQLRERVAAELRNQHYRLPSEWDSEEDYWRAIAEAVLPVIAERDSAIARLRKQCGLLRSALAALQPGADRLDPGERWDALLYQLHSHAERAENRELRAQLGEQGRTVVLSAAGKRGMSQ